jgi:hypothetical protein
VICQHQAWLHILDTKYNNANMITHNLVNVRSIARVLCAKATVFKQNNKNFNKNRRLLVYSLLNPNQEQVSFDASRSQRDCCTWPYVSLDRADMSVLGFDGVGGLSALSALGYVEHLGKVNKSIGDQSVEMESNLARS